MNRRTRSHNRRERRTVPYNIPTETLGHVYRHVENPSAFGMVNTTFRNVRTDPLFEKQRKLQMLENDIRRNGGSRIFIDNTPASAKDNKFFYYDSGCLAIVSGEIDVNTSINIKRVRYKAILGIKTIMGDPPFKPVGRFTLDDIEPDSERLGVEYVNVDPMYCNQFYTNPATLEEAYNGKIDENIPQLRSDLLRAIQSDVQNGCTPRVAWALSQVAKKEGKSFDYHRILNQYLDELRKAEAEQYTVRQIVDAFFLPIRIDLDNAPKIVKENVQLVGDTVEITIPIKLAYNIFTARMLSRDGFYVL